MKDSIYLVFDQGGVSRMTKRMPSMNGGEFCFRMNVSIPQDFFRRVIPVAELEVPESYIKHPSVEITLAD